MLINFDTLNSIYSILSIQYILLRKYFTKDIISTYKGTCVWLPLNFKKKKSLDYEHPGSCEVTPPAEFYYNLPKISAYGAPILVKYSRHCRLVISRK